MIFSNQINLVDRLFDQAKKQGWDDHILLRSSKRVWSYREVRDEVDRRAQVLINELKLSPGDRILLHGANTVGQALAWLGIVKAGLVAVPTTPQINHNRLIDIVNRTNPVIALSCATWLHELEFILQPYTTVKSIIPFNNWDSNSLQIKADAQPGNFDFHTNPDDIAMLTILEHGQTVIHTHQQILNACKTWSCTKLNLTSDDIVIGTEPFVSTFGLGHLLICPMWNGSSVYFHDKFYTPSNLVDTISQIGCTVCCTTPYFYQRMAAYIHTSSITLPKLQTSIILDKNLSKITCQTWKNVTGLQIIDGTNLTWI